MKYLDLSYCQFNSFDRSKKLFNLLKEKEILNIQDMFFSCGFNYVKVKDFIVTRNLLNSFLTDICCYKKAAILSYMNLNLSLHNISIDNLYQDLVNGSAEELEDFLLNSFNYDFLVIEDWDDLAQLGWFSKFLMFLEDYKFIDNMPVIIFQH